MPIQDVLFPAHAGMNRHRSRDRGTGGTVPRPRGDEPSVILRSAFL